MSRYIDIEPYEKDGWYLQKHYHNSYGEVIKTTPLVSVPTAEIESTKHGRWIWDKENDKMYCSECGYETDNWGVHQESDPIEWQLPNYCENCGARMDGTNKSVKSVKSVDLGNGFSISVNESQFDTQGRDCLECLYSPTCFGASIGKPACKAFVSRVRYVDCKDGGENDI